MHVRLSQAKVVVWVAFCNLGFDFLAAQSSLASGQQTYIPDRYKGVILFAPEPEMPSVALSNNKQLGTGVYRLIIDSRGTVDEVRVLRRIGVQRADAAAVFVLFKWKFKPGVLKSIDVPIAYTREFEAELRNAHCEAWTPRR